jgi:hypothetical protein
MVGMCDFDNWTGKVILYSDQLLPVQTIQHDDAGHSMYRVPCYIKDNGNSDIILCDDHSVVVTERGGRHRFSYTGPPSGSKLNPQGICTDALSHILVCDWNTKTIQMIDKDGHFLSLLLTRQHGICRPGSLNYDDKTHLLWVGSWDNNKVSVYRYIRRKYSLTGKY